MGGLINIIKTVKMVPDTIEKCVSCNAVTPYKFSDNIFFRNFYVEGSGQLCESCYIGVYDKA